MKTENKKGTINLTRKIPRPPNSIVARTIEFLMFNYIFLRKNNAEESSVSFSGSFYFARVEMRW